MNIKDALRQVNPFRTKTVHPVVKGPGYELGRGFSGGYTLDYYRNNYENGYPSIRVISQSFMTIEPYTVDKKGKSVQSNVLDRLYTPNKQMSAVDFREALAVMSLVHNKVYIRVHYTGTRITADSITGFTFVEGVSEHLVEGQLEYWLPNGEKLTTTEVITLKSINPYDLNDGFSPAYAARRWTTIDDLIADYQTGFFQNGGVPAGQFIITAKTSTEFNDIVAGMKERHQGAGKANNLMFAHRPVAPDGKPVDAQVEWVPFSSQNRDMALKDLFEQANKKIDSSYGVPASLRGVNDQNTYASVRVDERIFNEYTLDPFTLKVWSKFTHELNRMTGGIGVAISYHLEPVTIADEEKVKAEAKNLDARTVTDLTTGGYTLESAIAYVKTGDVSVLKQLPKDDEKPEVLDSEEAKNTPDQPVDLTLPSLKATHPKAKALSPEDRATYEGQLEEAVTRRMSAQIKAALSLASSKTVTPEQPVEPDEDEKLRDDMLAVLVAVVGAQGLLEHETNTQLVREAGYDVSGVLPFEMTGAQKAAYEAYVQKIATDYNAQTAEKIRNILSVGRSQNLTAAEIKKQLKGLLDEAWRIKRLAITEVNKAGNDASLWSMQNIAREIGARVFKVWDHSGGDQPCEFCRSYIGQEVALDEDFVSLGQTVHGADGGLLVNDFEPVQVGGMHPHCHCRQTYRVEAA